MRFLLTIFFGLVINHGTAQKLNINYRTATDSTERLHYLVFKDKSSCRLVYPNRVHGEVIPPPDFYFGYRVSNDTMTFGYLLLETNNIVKRLRESKFLITKDGKLVDLVSGFTYVDSKLVSDKYDIYSIDNKIYKQKRVKTDGYGLVRNDYRPNQRLKKRIKKLNPDNCKITILRGKKAYDKYGLIGMNGVIEIEEKK
jgi:hypothetical protein